MDTKSIKIPNVLQAKVAVVGDSSVGKTSVCHQISSDGTDFPKNYLMTTLCDVLVKSVKIPDTNDLVELYLMDSSGNEVYNETLKECWSQSNLIVAVFDVTKEDSLTSINKWIDLVNQCQKNEEKGDNNNTRLKGVLIANKIDLEDRRIVSPKAGAEVAQKLGLPYFECSAKDFKDVENPFYYLAGEWHKLHSEQTEKYAD